MTKSEHEQIAQMVESAKEYGYIVWEAQYNLSLFWRGLQTEKGLIESITKACNIMHDNSLAKRLSPKAMVRIASEAMYSTDYRGFIRHDEEPLPEAMYDRVESFVGNEPKTDNDVPL